MNLKTCTIGLAAMLLVLAGQGAMAQDAGLTPTGLAARYPSGSIQSSEAADQALREVEQQRAAVEHKYADEEHICYSKFFATSCLDKAKESRRVALGLIRNVEVDANAFIRTARVAQRDHDLAEKRARDASNPPKPITDNPAKETSEAIAPHSGNEGERHVADHEAKVKARAQEEAAKAPERADKAAAFDKKAADAEARQRDVAAKKAEKQRQAEEKAQKAEKEKQAAAKAAGKSPAPSSGPSAPATSGQASGAGSASAKP